MSGNILNQFSELEKMANNILQKRNQKQQEEMKTRTKKDGAKIIKKYQTIKKEALETQIFCHDGPFLVVVLLELNTFYSISKKTDIAMMIDLENIPKETVQGLLEAIQKKRINPKLKTKITITETFLEYIYRKGMSQNVKAFNLKTDLNIDNKIFQIIEAHNLKS